jgi:hypothetical protein
MYIYIYIYIYILPCDCNLSNGPVSFVSAAIRVFELLQFIFVFLIFLIKMINERFHSILCSFLNFD